MKAIRKLAQNTLNLVCLGYAALSVTGLQAQTLQGSVTVRGLTGSATYSVAGGPGIPVQVGAGIPVNTVVKTTAGSAVDLAFSHNAGVVRLLQSSTLSLDKFSAADATPGAPMDVQLYLTEGSMVGFDKKLSKDSKYQIKVAHGIADMGGSKFRIDAQGYLVVLEGNALFAFVSAKGDLVPFELKTPPAVYFSPLEGIRPAPVELVREVTLQTKGKLKSR